VDFKKLGDLIKQQAQIIEATVNRDAVATALSHTDAALSSLNTFVRTKNADDLRFASNESVLGVGFFLELSQTPPDVFFLPGLIKAGTARIAVIVAQDPNFLTSRPDDVDQISRMIALLRAMIDSIKQRIDAAHIVNERDHIIHSVPPKGIIDGFVHNELITDALGDTTTQELQFFHAIGLPEDPEDPRAAKALLHAQNARNQGVRDEIAFLGIPGFEAIALNWIEVITNPNSAPTGNSH
jgi:hypothetical protein